MGDFEALFGLVCSSYVTVSAGTHKRTPWNPLVDVNIDMVWCGNKLAAVNLDPSLQRVRFLYVSFTGITHSFGVNKQLGS